MLDFKVNEGAENMLIPSTVGSSIEKPNSKEIDFAMENTIQDQTSETTKHAVKLLRSFRHRVISAKHSRNGSG